MAECPGWTPELVGKSRELAGELEANDRRSRMRLVHGHVRSTGQREEGAPDRYWQEIDQRIDEVRNGDWDGI